MEDIIRVEGVEFTYNANQEEPKGIPAVKNMSFKIEEGQFVVVLGRNGSGKSTVARLLNALLLPSEGTIYVMNMNTCDESNTWYIRQTVGMVFQNPDNQMVATSVEEDVAFGPENLGISPEEIVKRVQYSINEVGMTDYINTAPHHLSGGQKQRVAIAGILAMKPRCIVLDEATSMLDPAGRKEVLSVLKKLNREEKITIIHITHHMEEAVTADRILVIDEGSIVMDGEPVEVFSRVEQIKKLGLDIPQVTKLFYELAKEGYGLSYNVLHVEDAVKSLRDFLKI